MIFLVYLIVGFIVAALTVVFMTRDAFGGPTSPDLVDYLTIGTCGLFAGAAWPAMIIIAPFALLAFLANRRRERNNS